jgi:malate dehydrogenase
VDEGLWYSFPCTCNNGEYTIVPNLPIDTFSAEMMEATRKELIQEREAALK